jgi:hypothetical protein
MALIDADFQIRGREIKTPMTPHPPSLSGRFSLSRVLLLAATLSVVGCISPAATAGTPTVRVENIRRAFHNGEHNAFTDLVRWKGKFWLAFRSSPVGHGVNSNSSVIILSSDDANTWRQVNQFSVAERDTRDPHFLIFGDKLFVYTGTAHVGKEGKRFTDWNAHLGYAIWTSDGSAWANPRALEGTYGHYIWRAAAHGGKAYLCARRWHEHNVGPDYSTMEAALLESDDGLRWRFVSLFQETMGNETAFRFELDGSLIAVSRSGPKGASGSVLSHSRPPYQEWTRQELEGYIGGPALARWGERMVVGGRRITPQGPRTTLLWLDKTKLQAFAELPSDGDNSYPGLVELDGGRLLVSWYSSHEKGTDGKPITAIYLAELAIQK